MRGDSESRGSDHWLDLAMADIAGAEVLLANARIEPRLSAGLAAQAAEKALKALIASLGIGPPRSHDLVRLAHLVDSPIHLPSDDDLRRLTDAHQHARYPEPDEAMYDREEAATLVEIGASVVREARAIIRNG